jgi:hypothetical protein
MHVSHNNIKLEPSSCCSMLGNSNSLIRYIVIRH